MKLSERDIYERVSRGELSVGEAEVLLARLDAGEEETATAEGFEERVRRHLEARLRQVLGLSGEIPMDRGFMSLGASSATLLSATKELERELGIELFPTIFFEHSSLEQLAAYFAENHADRLHAMLDARPAAPRSSASPASHATDISTASDPALGESPRSTANVPMASASPRPTPVPARQPVARDTREPRSFDVAIVGVSGRYPGARDLREFWKVLAEGRDCITEIPRDRWDHSRFFDPDRDKKGGAYSKWGGFLDDVDKFDPLFFNISPREAEIIDPQERLFLQTTWEALEDAGYTRVGLRRSGIRPDQAGMFVGVMWSTYQLFGAEESRLGRARALPVSAHWSVANRASYFFDFQGPSLTVDTACSSSLTALHLACESLRSGDCRIAVAGGVNLSLHPYKYVALSQWNFVSSDGRCRSFGEGGDGYVPGEGVGAVVLRPLVDAERDGDIIYAVIKGTAINHGGHANGFTVPNPNAQAAVIRRALERSGVDPATLSYIEAHGTGTALGDPIEIAGLNQAFRGHLRERASCPIGSVKSNIGHLEAAAGIAALTKVLLQFRHQTLVPSLHGDPPNPHIDFAATPFRVLREATEWRRPVLADGAEVPLRAAVSSFGAGGSNGHVVLEEYRDERRGTVPSHTGRELVLLSARTPERLREYGVRHLEQLDERRTSLEDLAYTLQVAREPMPERLALIVRDLDELRAKLTAFVEQGKLGEGVFAGSESSGTARLRGSEDEDQEYVRRLFDAGKLDRLAAFWTSGSDIDWARLRPDSGRRISLPTYPFARERCWMEDVPSLAPVLPTTRETFLAREWRPAPLSAPVTPLSARRLILLHDASAPDTLRRALGQLGPERARLVEVGRVARSAASGQPALDRDDLEAGARLAKEVFAGLRDVDGLIDLCDLTRADDGGRVDAARIGFYQGVLAERGTSPLFLLHVTSGLLSGETLTGAPMHGLVTAIAGEYRGVTARSVDVGSGEVAPEHLFTLLASEAERRLPDATATTDGRQSRYREGHREALTLREAPGAEGLTVVPDRAYVISGGTRGLGAAFARMLVERGARRLALLGAQALPPRTEWPRVSSEDSATGKKVRDLLDLEARGATVFLYTGSLADRAALRRFLGDVRAKLGPIAGVLHCAGTLSDESPAFLHKTRHGIERVLEPKLAGTHALADLLEDDRPDFFVLFSSVSAVVPSLSVGLSDYSLANAFLDRFAEFQHRRGRTWFRSLNWPSFRDTGFGETTTEAYRAAGLSTLTVEQGLSLLDGALGIQGQPVLLPCSTLPGFAPGALFTPPPAPATPTRAAVPDAVTRATGDQGGARAAAYAALVQVFSSELKLAPERFKGNVRFEEYGADSVLIASAVKKLEKVIGAPVEPGFLLEYPTLDTLSAFLATRYPTSFAAQMSREPPAPTTTPLHESRGPVAPHSAAPAPVAHVASRPSAESSPAPAVTTAGQVAPIAIVGIACRFPGAPDKESFWKMLAGGECPIQEVPADRWDADRYYSPEPGPGRTNSKWGGFIEGIDLFDPAYFRISESVALQMDPLQRLMLETTLLATLDAGYTREELSNRRIGVYVGTRSGNYMGRVEQPERNTIVGVGQNFIAARISDFFNWRGTNLVVDTACSSSLVSTHLACQALRDGEIDAAISGGVDVLLDELTYLTLSAAGALSPDGRCHTFDERANGFVPGEGVGALMLKRLDDALRDGDRVYAVIRGSAVNNDGRTMGITTPNMEAQIEVIEAALARGGLAPSQISHLEAHGTGTMIGDPIELKALATVFRRATDARGFCAVGSVKTNIGHLLSAAGMAGLVKTALALEHRQLPPTLHCERPNPRFAFDASPFYVNRELRDWAAENEQPRRAGISAFGFGGTNCHMILEEPPASHLPGRTPLAAPVFSKRRYLLPARRTEERDVPLAAAASPDDDAPLLRLEPLADERPGRPLSTGLRAS